MTLDKVKFFILTSLLVPITAHSTEETQAQQIDSLASACLQATKKDKICEAIITMKQIGDDSIEAIKEYIDLTPSQYAVLTAINYAASGRIRIRTNSKIIPGARHIYDIKKDTFMIYLEKDF
ncbi:MAG: hypothetical protein BroJett040_13240 [Oligoflexia bacterium]|nr:MAG: hypothetical protein BroJett040_13240 [Oligoflexia bacterium]